MSKSLPIRIKEHGFLLIISSSLNVFFISVFFYFQFILKVCNRRQKGKLN